MFTLSIFSNSTYGIFLFLIVYAWENVWNLKFSIIANNTSNIEHSQKFTEDNLLCGDKTQAHRQITFLYTGCFLSMYTEGTS